MKKLKLELEELRVESLETTAEERRDGTVHAAQYPSEYPCGSGGTWCISRYRTYCDETVCWA